MKNILNPSLMKEKITMIGYYSSQEEMEEEESIIYHQVHIKKEHLVILKSSPGRNKVAEQPIYFSTERGRSSKVLVEEEVVKDEEAR